MPATAMGTIMATITGATDMNMKAAAMTGMPVNTIMVIITITIEVNPRQGLVDSAHISSRR